MSHDDTHSYPDPRPRHGDGRLQPRLARPTMAGGRAGRADSGAPRPCPGPARPGSPTTPRADWPPVGALVVGALLWVLVLYGLQAAVHVFAAAWAHSP